MGRYGHGPPKERKLLWRKRAFVLKKKPPPFGRTLRAACSLNIIILYLSRPLLIALGRNATTTLNFIWRERKRGEKEVVGTLLGRESELHIIKFRALPNKFLSHPSLLPYS